METAKESFDYERVDISQAFLSFKARNSGLLDLFLAFYDRNLIKAIWDAGNRDNKWTYQLGKTINGGKLCYILIYRFLAVIIRIIGLQNKASESRKNSRPLRYAIQEAMVHFNHYAKKTPGRQILEHLAGNFLISNEFFPLLSLNFQSIVSVLGQCVAGDEKLFHFTGNSSDIRMCISKPDRVGIWFYEICGMTGHNFQTCFFECISKI